MNAHMSVASDRRPLLRYSVAKAVFGFTCIAVTVGFIVAIVGIGWPVRVGIKGLRTIKYGTSSLVRTLIY